MKLLIALSFGLAITFCSMAQKVFYTSPETDWQLVPCISNAPQGFDDFTTRTLEKSVIPVEKGHIYPVQLGKNEYGILLADNKGNAKWKARTKGFVIGLAKFKGNLICFYSPEWNNGGPGKIIRNLYAGVFDVNNGKQIFEKEIFVNRTEWNADPKVMVTSDLQFAHILIRYSQFVNSQLFIARETEKLLTTEKIEVISTNGSEEFKRIEIPSNAVHNRFISCEAMSSTEFVIASENGGVVTTERFSINDAGHPKKYTFNTNASAKFFRAGFIKYDPTYPNVLYEVVCFYDNDYKKQIAVAKLDFTSEKFVTTSMPMDKELAETFTTDSKKKDKQFRNTINSMGIVDLVIQNDKLLLLTQIHHLFQGPERNRPLYGNNEIMITSLDDKLKKTRAMIISRQYEIFMESGEKFGYHITGDRMHLVYNEVHGIGVARAGCEYTVVDLRNFSIIESVALPRDGLKNYATIEPEAVVWTDETAFIPYNNMPGIKNGQTVFQTVELKK